MEGKSNISFNGLNQWSIGYVVMLLPIYIQYVEIMIIRLTMGYIKSLSYIWIKFCPNEVQFKS